MRPVQLLTSLFVSVRAGDRGRPEGVRARSGQGGDDQEVVYDLREHDRDLVDGRTPANSTSNWFLGFNTGYTNPNWGPSGYAVGTNNVTGLPAADDNLLFGPIDISQTPTAVNQAGAIQPYFALAYLPFQWPHVAPQNQWQWGITAGANNCVPAQYAH